MVPAEIRVLSDVNSSRALPALRGLCVRFVSGLAGPPGATPLPQERCSGVNTHSLKSCFRTAYQGPRTKVVRRKNEIDAPFNVLSLKTLIGKQIGPNETARYAFT